MKIFFAIVLFAYSCVAAAQNIPYKNKTLSPQARTKDLLARMTTDEKLMQLQCMWISKSKILNTAGDFDSVKAKDILKNGLGELARLNEKFGSISEGVHPKEAALLYNKIQHYFVEHTRLGIPVMVHEESLHGQQTQDATNFPVPIALAGTWNENLITEIFTSVAQEVRARGGQHVLAPVLDIVRDPRWGRTEETLGEDPFLTSALAIAEINAYQGTGEYLGPDKVAVTLKHFGIHGQSEGGINVSPSNIDERTAREIFLKPFERCIKEAKPFAVMACYNELWGIPAHANKKLLTDILRKEWHFNGMVVSDYFAVSDLVNLHRLTPALSEAALLAFKAGVDMETPDPAGFISLKKYTDQGKISMKELDEKVGRILIAKFRLGLFDNPYADAGQAEIITGSPQKRNIAYRAAAESMVLLKNDSVTAGTAMLPLNKSNIKTLAIIGPNAARCLLGGYSGQPRVCVSPLQAIQEKYGSGIRILYAEGVTITDKNNWFADTVSLAENSNAKTKIAEAVAAAKQADAVVLFVGGNESTSREGWAANHLGDLPSLNLLNGQEELITALAATGKPICALVNSGPPLSLGHLLQNASAVIQCWYLGQEGGYAMADVLFGEINPSGKLPISFPRSAGHIPAYYNYKPSARRGYNLGFDVSPLFAFGYGLSYSTFRYGKPVLSSAEMKMDSTVTVSITVQNSGAVKAGEVVQLYIRDDYSSVPRPVKELKGFKKITLEPGELQTVQFKITKEQLSFFDENMKWIAEPGDFTIMLGTSSDKTNNIGLKLIK